MLNRLESIHGAIVGTMVGDALGLPYEHLSPRRAARIFGEPTRHRFCLGRGMISDDGEHTCMVAQSLAECPTDADAFARRLASRLRWWIVCLPAGAGGATLRACIKLWLGFGPKRAGVRSAGNGPAMRAAVIGAAIHDPDQLAQYVSASTRLTHTDPQALAGAMLVARAARLSSAGSLTTDAFFDNATSALAADALDDMRALMQRVRPSIERAQITTDFAIAEGWTRGVSGFINHSVAIALHACLSHPNDFARAVQSVIRCGGDTDTTAAIVGGILGAGVGAQAIPSDWRDQLLEFPRTQQWVQRLSIATDRAMQTRTAEQPPRVSPTVIVRNVLFIGVIAVHLLRRAIPF